MMNAIFDGIKKNLLIFITCFYYLVSRALKAVNFPFAYP